jgi:hypothetical protein
MLPEHRNTLRQIYLTSVKLLAMPFPIINSVIYMYTVSMYRNEKKF